MPWGKGGRGGGQGGGGNVAARPSGLCTTTWATDQYAIHPGNHECSQRGNHDGKCTCKKPGCGAVKPF